MYKLYNILLQVFVKETYNAILQIVQYRSYYDKRTDIFTHNSTCKEFSTFKEYEKIESVRKHTTNTSIH